MTGGPAFHLTASSQVAGSGGGILHAVVVNKGAASATVTLHDGDSSGPVIAVIDASAAQPFPYDATLTSGLYVAVSGSIDVTVILFPGDQYAP